MSHKEKICETAVTAHIEDCYKHCTYAPLAVELSYYQKADQVHHGLGELIKSEISQRAESEVEAIQKDAYSMKEAFHSLSSSRVKDILEKETDQDLSCSKIGWSDLIGSLSSDFDKKIESVVENAQAELALEIRNSSPALNLAQPTKAIEARLPKYTEAIEESLGSDESSRDLSFKKVVEIDELGMFFSEGICIRSEGIVKKPCGEEFSILPGESISESNTLTTTVENSETGTWTTSQELTTTDREETTETLKSSYERNLKKEMDIKHSVEAGFKIPFKKLSLDLSRKSNIDFNRVLDETRKSSREFIRETFSEVVNTLKSSSSMTQSSSFNLTSETSFSREWKNETELPMTFIKHENWCKHTVIHKRTNVQLAFSGCIEDPGRDLCTPDNLKEKLADQIQAIRDKWAKATPPSSFGARPSNRTICTPSSRYSNWRGAPKDMTISGTIPGGDSYVGNPVLQITNNNTMAQNCYIKTQPSTGATGGISFDVRVDFKDRWRNREEADIAVCFEIASQAAHDWDVKVNAWREEQAEAEIALKIQEETEALSEYLQSEQAHAGIIRRIMEDYFGVTDDDDECCKLIKKLHKFFDFDHLCYSLYPAWNSNGQGCQTSQPVNIYTALCLAFYLPINQGMELEALALLGSINAIPWNNNLIGQYVAYVNQIDQMRQTKYKRAFDPTGWDKKFDDPLGYKVTPYDTNTPNQWSADFETDLPCEVVNAFTVTTPCGGFSYSPVPLLC